MGKGKWEGGTERGSGRVGWAVEPVGEGVFITILFILFMLAH